MTPAEPRIGASIGGLILSLSRGLTSLLGTAALPQQRGEEQEAAESLHLVRSQNFWDNVRHTRALRGSQRRPHAPLRSEERKVLGERRGERPPLLLLLLLFAPCLPSFPQTLNLGGGGVDGKHMFIVKNRNVIVIEECSLNCALRDSLGVAEVVITPRGGLKVEHTEINYHPPCCPHGW